MAEKPDLPSSPAPGTDFSHKIGRKEQRRLTAQRNKNRDLWIGFRMMGLVGWAVTVPSLLGVALGIWIDTHHPGRYSWTLMLLLLGILLGCYNAWYWVARESGAMREEQEKDNNDDGDA
jgi:ATP synthase protein I